MNTEPTAIKIPDMEADEAAIEKSNVLATYILGGEVLVSLYLFLSYLNWNYLFEVKLTAFVIAGLAAYESVVGYVMLIAMNKTKVDDLKNDTVLGYYSKQQLLDVVKDSLTAMGLGYNATSVFITREKSANASAVKTGMNPFFKSLNAIYINRTILHILKPDELKAIIGHELAHNFRHKLLIQRYGIVHFLFSTGLAFVVLQHIKADSGFAMISVFIVLSLVNIGLSMIGSHHNKRIEYLCDFEGAQIAGTIPAINSLLKIGAQAEAELFLQMSTFLKAHKKSTLSASEILDIYERNLPFGKFEPELVAQKIEQKIAQKSLSKKGLSLKGFIEYLKDNEQDESVDEELEKISREMRALEKIPKIDWAEDLLLNEKESLTFADIESIVKELHLNESLLFRLPDEVSDRGSTHPSFRNRVLSLWYNTTPWLNRSL